MMSGGMMSGGMMSGGMMSGGMMSGGGGMRPGRGRTGAGPSEEGGPGTGAAGGLSGGGGPPGMGGLATMTGVPIARSASVIAVKAVVPYRKQADEYKRVLGEAIGYDPLRDQPRIIFFQAQRADVTDNPAKELQESDWQLVMTPKTAETRAREQRWHGVMPEIADPTYIDPNATMPGPPMMLRCMEEVLLHSEVPRSKIVAMFEAPAEDEGKTEEGSKEGEKEEGSDLPGGCLGGLSRVVDIPACPVCPAVIPVHRVADIPACPACLAAVIPVHGVVDIPACPVSRVVGIPVHGVVDIPACPVSRVVGIRGVVTRGWAAAVTAAATRARSRWRSISSFAFLTWMWNPVSRIATEYACFWRTRIIRTRIPPTAW